MLHYVRHIKAYILSSGTRKSRKTEGALPRVVTKTARTEELSRVGFVPDETAKSCNRRTRTNFRRALGRRGSLRKIAEDHIDGDVGVIIVQLLLKYRMSGPAKMAKASKIHALHVEGIAILSTIGGIRSARKNH